MASFFSNIFSAFSGASKDKVAPTATAEPQAHAGCTIHAAPIREGSQYRLAGRIEKVVDGETLERTFIRADVLTSADDALECTFRKARQIIDQNGTALFADGVRSRPV